MMSSPSCETWNQRLESEPMRPPSILGLKTSKRVVKKGGICTGLHRLAPEIENHNGPRCQVQKTLLEGSKACWFLIVRLVISWSKLIVLFCLFSFNHIREPLSSCIGVAKLSALCIRSYAPNSPQVIGHESFRGSLPGHFPESCDPSITTFDTLPLRIVRSLLCS